MMSYDYSERYQEHIKHKAEKIDDLAEKYNLDRQTAKKLVNEGWDIAASFYETPQGRVAPEVINEDWTLYELLDAMNERGINF